MAFKKQVTHTTHTERESFDLNNHNDLRIIREFEMEIEPFMNQERFVFGQDIKGFQLYLHDNALFRRSDRYPDGAVVPHNMDAYRLACMKYNALTDLINRRKYAQEQHNPHIN